MKKLSIYLLFLLLPFQLVLAQETSPKDDDIIKVLAIGNSFSEDALENYLYELSTAAGKKNCYRQSIHWWRTIRTAPKECA
ncbi:DUF4886 domain-containing protein [Sphingobacterium daejeonense]|uniref:DUF4886 domain-containing protein n=1 Tax=Sphingobacterium daejeonense TaxID=371142 RepID=UPI0037437E32